MALVSCELLNYADSYFCYAIKQLITLSSKCKNKNVTALPRRTRALLPHTLNLSPATPSLGENPGENASERKASTEYTGSFAGSLHVLR